MKVVATHFVMVISKPFGEVVREIKKVYALENGEFIIEHQGKQISYEKIRVEQFNKLKANGLEVDPDAPLVY